MTDRNCSIILFAALAIASAAGSLSAATISVDFDERPGPALTYPGFQSYMIDGTAALTADTVRTFGSTGVRVQLAGSVTYDDRIRATPTNAGAFTQAEILRDFLFATIQPGAPANNNGNNRGLDVYVTGLVPFGVYSGSVWSFDSGSPRPRVSDWSANGLTFRNNYTFDGSVLPTDNNARRMDFFVIASPDGAVTLRGRKDTTTAANDPGVFLNAFELDHQSTIAQVIGPELSVDFGPGASTLPGFVQMQLGSASPVPSASQTFGAKTVTVTGVGVNLQQRDRTSPVNDAIFTQAQLLQDFIFAGDVGTTGGAFDTTGLDIEVEGLFPGRQYLATIWSYDQVSSGARAASWTSDTGTVVSQFAGEALPRNNEDYRFSLLVTADANGSLVLSGRKSADGTDNFAVFVNAMELRPIIPEPSSIVLGWLGIACGCFVWRRQRRKLAGGS